MTPKPPSSSDSSPLSPRHRPSLGNLAHDTTEIDLWAFDDEIEGPEPRLSGPRDFEEIVKPAGGELPPPRGKMADVGEVQPLDAEKSIQKTPGGGEDRIRMNVSKSRVRNPPAGIPTTPSIPESDFDDLDNWEDLSLRPEPQVEIPRVIPAPDEPEEIRKAQESVSIEEPVAAPSPVEDNDDEFSPVKPANAAPISLRPHLGLSGLERLGLIILMALLAITAAFILIASSKGIRTESVKASERDFPIQGAKLVVKSAMTYWRPPITEGPEAEVFRRDTRLLPVLELEVGGAPGAIRVLFRNEERTIVGDAVNRSIQNDGLLKIAATAGFDDLGMHAAYRTGESKPWTIEVYEDVGSDDFRLLFEMNISTDRR